MIRDKVMKEILTPSKLDDFNHEDVLREKMLAFERAQVKKKLRPPMPVDVKIAARNARLIPQVVEQKRLAKAERAEKLREILDVMRDIEVLNASQIAERMGSNAFKLNNYLAMLNKQGYLHKIETTNSDRKIIYAYIKTGKVFDGRS